MEPKSGNKRKRERTVGIDQRLSEILVNNRYQLVDKIGSGSFGDVFTAIDIINGETVAVKMESLKVGDSKQLAIEQKIYPRLANINGIPKMRWYGKVVLNSETGATADALVMDHLGPCLEDMIQKFKTLSLITTLLIADQVLTVLDSLHGCYFIHRDIKPDNFVLGPPGSPKQLRVYIVDFGLAQRYRDGQRVHIPFRMDRRLTGTARYASVNSHRGFELSRRDDLESLGYVLIYLLKGRLPWQGLGGSTRKDRYLRIGDLKASISLETLCEGLPSEMLTYMNYSRNLRFEDNPDYCYLKHLFRSLRRITPAGVGLHEF